jgi:hypothetical protein
MLEEDAAAAIEFAGKLACPPSPRRAIRCSGKMILPRVAPDGRLGI